MKKALITGSGGLIGSACTQLLLDQGWMVYGIDNDSRKDYFGHDGSTQHISNRFAPGPWFELFDEDIRGPAAGGLLRWICPDLIIHTAAQPSHDLAASIPYDDWDTNATATMMLLQAARETCPESPFVFCSTNKVYGDRPNRLPLKEAAKRFDFIGRDGIDELLPVDQCLHSLFGASKLAADVLCQEYGRYFGMPVGIFRGGCLTGPQHAAVELHGFLAYIVESAVTGKPYTVYGYHGKQVRDQIHCDDVARLFLEFYRNPRCGEVYNLGGGKANSASILEVIDMLAAAGHRLQWAYEEMPRRGDHICYYTDLSKVRRDFPNWKIEHSLPAIVEELIAAKRKAAAA